MGSRAIADRGASSRESEVNAIIQPLSHTTSSKRFFDGCTSLACGAPPSMIK
jgi:hypothetical protein